MFPENLTLYPFKGADQDALVAFWIDIWTEMGWPLDELEGKESVSALFQLPKGICIVLKRNQSETVGCAGVLPLEPGVGLLKRFYLAPELRGKGLAASLLSDVITAARDKQIKTLVLDVSKENKRAQQFYQKMGFVPYNPAGHGYDSVWPESTEPQNFIYLQVSI